MDKPAKTFFDRKRFILDLIDDVPLALCKYNIGDKTNREALSQNMESIVVKHIENLKVELADFVEKGRFRDVKGNGVCNFSCT